jgi:multidrug transporter EmrE-like cation transporter
MSYLFLAGTIFFESLGIALLNRSEGLNLPRFLFSGIIFLNIGMFCFALALKDMDMTIANTTWAGASILTVALIGYYVFDERYDPIQYFCIFLVTVGLVGLNLSGLQK